MANITLFTPNPKSYTDASGIHVSEDSGVLTFYCRAASTNVNQKVTTTVPYLIEEPAALD
jgi:hypothetical protein